MVVFTEKIQKRHGQLFQIHTLATKKHLALNKQILLVAIFNKLAESFSGNIRTVENPAFHAHKIFHKILVVHIVHKTDIFIDHQARRIKQQKSQIHDIAGNIAESFNHPIHVDVFHPDMQKTSIRVEA